VLEVIGLMWSLHRRIESVEEAAVLRSLGRAGVAAFAAGLLMLGGLTVVESSMSALLENSVGRLAVLLALSAAGAAIFLVVAAGLRSPELDQLRGVLRRRRGRTAA
jgi:uncharacterized protein (DUF2342 family)